MKKIRMMLVMTMLILLCSCEKTAMNERTEEVILTEENFEDYFNVNIYNSDYNEQVSTGFTKEYSYSCILNIEISPLGDLKQMMFVLHILLILLGTTYRIHMKMKIITGALILKYRLTQMSKSELSALKSLQW